MRRALASCWRIRRASVLVPRSASQQSNGPGTAPEPFWMNPSRSATSSRLTTTIPPTMSLWPFRYVLVGRVDERELETEARPDVRHLAVRAAVHVFAAHHVVAG